jgi:hypothetical protein
MLLPELLVSSLYFSPTRGRAGLALPSAPLFPRPICLAREGGAGFGNCAVSQLPLTPVAGAGMAVLRALLWALALAAFAAAIAATEEVGITAAEMRSVAEEMLEELESEIEYVEVGLFGTNFGKWKEDGELVFRDNEVSLVYGIAVAIAAVIVFCGALPDVE